MVSPIIYEKMLEKALAEDSDIVVCDYIGGYRYRNIPYHQPSPQDIMEFKQMILDGRIHNGLWNKLIRMILAPVYGMVHTDDGMGYLAIIESGDEEASIYATPNGAYSDYNWITAAFRKCTTYIQPTSNSGGSVTKVTDRIKYDINITRSWTARRFAATA